MLPFTRPTIAEEDIEAVLTVLKSAWLTTGPKAVMLEEALASYIGGKVQVLLFNSATSALEAALLANNIGPGDEVIVPAMSFVATANVVLRVGARPVFVDVDFHSRNIDANKVEAAITNNTRAIIPVHFAGLAVDLDPLYQLADKKKIIVIEDAAQAIGTTYKARQVGSSGNPVCFSFHPNKNITTIEGGALATGDPELAKRLQRLRFHGIEKGEDGITSVSDWGGKMNLADVSAALGLAQLPRLDSFIRRRQQLAILYLQKLPHHFCLTLPSLAIGHSWHMFNVCFDGSSFGQSRQQVINYFESRKIILGSHYPAIHLFPLYKRFGYRQGDFPAAEKIAEQTLTLPLFPTMTDQQTEQVCKAFEDLIARKSYELN